MSCVANVYFSPPVGGDEERSDFRGHVYVTVAPDPGPTAGTGGRTYVWRPTGVAVGTRALALEGPTTIDFGRVRIGARSPRLNEFGQSFTIRNTGSLSVDIDLKIWTAGWPTPAATASAGTSRRPTPMAFPADAGRT